MVARTAASGPSGLKVLHVGKYYPPHPGGMESHLEVLCRELGKHLTVEVVVANDSRETVTENDDGVQVTRLGKYFDFKAAPVCPSLVSKIRSARAEVVHIHWPNPTAVMALLASGYKGRLVFTYHSDVVRQKILSRVFTPLLRRALDRTDRIIVSSPNYIEASDILSAYRDRCRVIPFGISVEHFMQRDEATVEDLRRRFGSRIVLGVGRLVYYKGFEHLIRAMKYVEGQLVIVGEGPLLPRLESEARTLGVSDRVTLLTDVKDVRPFFHAADVFALPSVARSEAFGIVQLEAMACGKPVVNTKLDSGVPFVSQDGVTGVTVPPADARALGSAINSLFQDRERRVSLGRAGRLRVESEFSVEKMIERTLEVYGEITR